MRKVHGIKNLIAYLEFVDFPLTEEQVNDLLLKKELPHLRPLKHLIVFNLDHIDWWISQQRLKP
ncbi:hypothetical protein [Bacillus sp. PK3_68]|uniref:hypothetical protein n=1 Tax=Bacillus sp. PK3_68 TaxID=2027408 RepID=UPI000E769100|nr:hypothetical protein [Bacillus sp. PK3_68]RJS59322.1 hypothetical protein CJ483_03920 [Bacillus sp. PK3_68]